MIYNLGFPGNPSATMALGSVEKVAAKAITADTDCFDRALRSNSQSAIYPICYRRLTE